jgi:hypothetical protein
VLKLLWNVVGSGGNRARLRTTRLCVGVWVRACIRTWDLAEIYPPYFDKLSMYLTPSRRMEDRKSRIALSFDGIQEAGIGSCCFLRDTTPGPSAPMTSLGKS